MASIHRDHLELDRVSVDAIDPWVLGRPPDPPHCTPDRAVALEPRPERELPDLVAAPDSPFGLQVRKLIPNAAARSVPESVQHSAGRLHVAVSELQVLLKLVEHDLAGRVDAEVLECEFVVGNVGLGCGRGG